MKTYLDREIMLSKRGFIFYLEHTRVKMENSVLVYVKAENGIFKSYNVPYCNTSIVMIGEGTSITRDAVETISSSGTLLMFVGGKGSPLYASSDLSFTIISPDCEYCPTLYMQNWASIFFNEDLRLYCAKEFTRIRVDNIKLFYNKLDFIQEMGISSNDILDFCDIFISTSNKAKSEKDLLSAEAVFTKRLYGMFAKTIKLNSFIREHGKRSHDNDMDIINGFLDHGNYLMYGMASVALNGLGISYAFPLLHGKTRRGALVFDVADLIKDAICLPLAFYSGINGYSDSEFRDNIMFYIEKEKILDKLFASVKEVSQIKEVSNA